METNLYNGALKDPAADADVLKLARLDSPSSVKRGTATASNGFSSCSQVGCLRLFLCFLWNPNAALLRGT